MKNTKKVNGLKMKNNMKIIMGIVNNLMIQKNRNYQKGLNGKKLKKKACFDQKAKPMEVEMKKKNKIRVTIINNRK